MNLQNPTDHPRVTDDYIMLLGTKASPWQGTYLVDLPPSSRHTRCDSRPPAVPSFDLVLWADTRSPPTIRVHRVVDWQGQGNPIVTFPVCDSDRHDT